ncbi:MAG TPA: RDD family protein [Victivallales bacterium]|nr:RDD family protein [Victivallales bacterium]
MEYNVLVNDNEYGPINEEILIKWVEDGRILPDTAIRNSMFNVWKKASDYHFLDNAFKHQQMYYDENISTTVKLSDKHNSKPAVTDSKNIPEEKKVKTSFENEYLPSRVKISLRLKAGIIDIILLGIIFVILFSVGICISEGYSLNHSHVFVFMYCLFLALMILYLGVGLGTFAQTVGMWFFGILLVRNCDEATEVYFLRAYFYALLMVIFGIISPITNFILFRKRALHDILTDTQVVSISAKSK